MKKALITGITGQDGSYLAELLLRKGYEVHGIIRRSSSFNTERLDQIYQDPHEQGRKLFLHYGDLNDASSINRIIERAEPDEIYNLGAQSHVQVSFEIPEFTSNVDGLGALRLLDAIKDSRTHVKVYQAGSSEMFGKAWETPQKETTPFHPRSPYACAKAFAYHIAVNYREAYGLFVSNGILFNHESPRRGGTFVTKKITNTLAKIKLGLAKPEALYLGNLNARRDWGYAKEYCVDLQTSILTIQGFKFYDEIKVDDIVLNYNPKKNALTKDKVLKKILLDNDGEMYILVGRGFKLRCSGNHRIYYQRKSKKSKGGWSDWKITTAKEFHGMVHNLNIRTKYDLRLPHTQGYFKKDVPIKDEWFKLIGYLVSEGCKNDHNRSLIISVSQSKKINKKIYQDIKRCLRVLKLKFREREIQNGNIEFVFNSKSSKKIIDYFNNYDIHVLPPWIFTVGHRQLKLLLDAMMDGDGSWGVMTYVSKRLDLIHSFQTLATILGYRTILHKRKSGIYECVLISKRKKYSYVTKAMKENSQEKVWCISTNNGTMVTNKDGAIAVSGNCEAMWLMLQQAQPDDYVIATGESHSVREFATRAAQLVGYNLEWQGMGMNEKGIDAKTGKILVEIDSRYFRPSEVDTLLGDATKAKDRLGWTPHTTFDELIRIMMEAEFTALGVKPEMYITS